MLGSKPWGSDMYEVVIARDEGEGVYYVYKSDIKGLHAEAETLEALEAIILDVAPELIEANHTRARGPLAALFQVFGRRHQTHIKVTRDLCIA